MADTQTSEWIKHDGNGNPVRQMDIVEVKFRNGELGAARPAYEWRGNWNSPYPSDGDIVAFRVVKP